MIRGIIIDDELIVATGIRGMFHPSRDGIAIVENYRDVDETLSKPATIQFDFIILDLWIRRTSPQENVRTLRVQFPSKPILIFSHDDSLEWKRKMIHEGVNGYISKGSTKKEIKTAIQGIIYRGTYFLPTILTNQFQEDFDVPEPIEYSIILLLSEGYQISDIAYKRRLSIATIERILLKLRKTYNSRNNCELVVAFLKMNFQS